MIYHVTTMEALPSILAEGLVPSIGPRARDFGEQESAVYAFASLDAVEDALSGWLGDALEEDAEIAILEIDLERNPEPGQFEVVLTEIVPPELIARVLNEELAEIDVNVRPAVSA